MTKKLAVMHTNNLVDRTTAGSRSKEGIFFLHSSFMSGIKTVLKEGIGFNGFSPLVQKSLNRGVVPLFGHTVLGCTFKELLGRYAKFIVDIEFILENISQIKLPPEMRLSPELHEFAKSMNIKTLNRELGGRLDNNHLVSLIKIPVESITGLVIPLIHLEKNPALVLAIEKALPKGMEFYVHDWDGGSLNQLS